MATTKYADINQRTAAWAASKMLSHAEPVLILQKFALSKPLPKRTADTVKFRRPIPFAAATIPLVEGVTPSSQKMRYEDVIVQLKTYGRPIEISDVIEDMAEDPVLSDAAMLAGEQAPKINPAETTAERERERTKKYLLSKFIIKPINLLQIQNKHPRTENHPYYRIQKFQ